MFVILNRTFMAGLLGICFGPHIVYPYIYIYYLYLYIYIYVSIYIYAFNHHKCVFVSMLWLGFCSAGVITIVFVFTSVVSFCSFGSPEPLLALELLCKVPVHT